MADLVLLPRPGAPARPHRSGLRARWWPAALGAAGGLAVSAGAFLPWVSVLGGLVRFAGVRGIYGRGLAVGGAVAVAVAVGYLLRGGRGLRLVLGILGFGLAALAVYPLLGLEATLHALGSQAMVAAGRQPGVYVCAAGALAVLGTLFLPADREASRAAATAVPWRPGRRGIELALGGFWLLDAALQLQPSMFGRGFARGVLAPAAAGQPAWVAAAVRFAAGLAAAHPLPFDLAVAGVQLGLAVGLLARRTAAVALPASMLWAGGVWLFGEGLGGLASGHAGLLGGAPGAAAVYLLLAAACWTPRIRGHRRGAERMWVARWLPWAWAVLWLGAAGLQAAPGQNSAAALAGTLMPMPALSALDGATSGAVHRLGLAAVALLVAVEVAVALLALRPGRARRCAAAAGSVLALGAWVLGQGMGMLGSGRATDPNTGPVLVLLAVALLAVPPARPGAGGARAARASRSDRGVAAAVASPAGV